MTQTERILMWLRRGPVCATTMWNENIKRGAARIGNLKAQGHRIETRTCENPTHTHGGRYVEYVLIEAPEQLRM